MKQKTSHRPKKEFVKNKRCPECNYKQLTLDGHQIVRRRKQQRYLCHHCFRRTLYPKDI